MAVAKKKSSAKTPVRPSAVKRTRPTAKKTAPAQPSPKKVARPNSASVASRPLPFSKKLPANTDRDAAQQTAAKLEKQKKPKLVRDSFTIPKVEYLVLDELKLRAAQLTRPAKKSELLRAGIKALAALSDAAFLAALEQVPAIKTGRPAL